MITSPDFLDKGFRMACLDSGSGFPMTLKSDCGWGHSHLSEDSSGIRRFASKVAHWHSWQFDAGEFVPLHVVLSTVLLASHHGMTAGFPKNVGSQRPRLELRYFFWPSPGNYSVGAMRQSCFTVAGDHAKLWVSARRTGSLGDVSEADYHTSHRVVSVKWFLPCLNPFIMYYQCLTA